MRVLVKAPLDTSSGYGNDGHGIVRALLRAGHEVFLHPTAVTPPISPEVASLLTKAYIPPFDLAIVHVDPVHLEVENGMRRATRRIVGWTMWEWESFRPDIEGYEGKDPAEEFSKATKNLDLLACYDEVTSMALSGLAQCPSTVIQGGFWSEDWPIDPDRDWSVTFRFAMVGQLHDRKDPFAAIEAFGKLKDEYGDAFDAELHLKTNTTGLMPQLADRWPGIVIHRRWWPTAALRRFYGGVHCYLAPSRGEGKNVPALEAQSTGIPVIATDFGGHHVWFSEEWGYSLRYERHEYAMGVAAKADRDHLAELMWHVYTNRAEARQKGLLAARTIPPMCDWDQVLRRFMNKVLEVEGREPEDPNADSTEHGRAGHRLPV